MPRLPEGQPLTPEQIDYIIAVLARWLEKPADTLLKCGNLFRLLSRLWRREVQVRKDSGSPHIFALSLSMCLCASPGFA